MKFKLLVSICLLTALFSSCTEDGSRTKTRAGVEIDLSACQGMFDILAMMRQGAERPAVEAALDSMLGSKTYQTMFRHYNRSWRPNHLPEDVFKRMILSLRFPEAYATGENRRADQMLPKWQDCYANPAKFKRHLDELEQVGMGNLVYQAIETAESWLPPEMRVNAFYLTIFPHGGSGGFAIGEAQGYDFFQLTRDSLGALKTAVLGEIIAHECHHLGLEIPGRTFAGASDSLAFDFLKIFVGEGTATKFINNCHGGRVPCINSDRINSIMDPGLNEMTRPHWEAYTAGENELIERMTETLEKAVSGQLNRQQLNEELSAFWITGMIGRNYFLGSEFFGAIYYGLGRDACLDVMRDPRIMLDYYNRAVRKRPDLLGGCPLVPQKAVDLALGLWRGS